MEVLIEYGGIVLRTVGLYLLIVFIIRFFGRKEMGNLSVPDLVFVLLIAELTAPSMLGGNETIFGGGIAFIAIFLANKILDLIMFYSPALRDKVSANPVMVIYKGEIKQDSLEKLKLSKKELYEILREHGEVSEENIKYGIMEGDGSFSVIKEKS